MSQPQQWQQTRLGWSLEERDPKLIELVMPLWEWFYRYYFRVQTSGWEHIQTQQQYLIVGSHNGGFAAPDMVMMIYDWFRHFGVEKPIYGLIHPKSLQISPEFGQIAVKIGAISGHPKVASAALRQGASVLVYPGGGEDLYRLHSLRHQIYFAGRQSFIKLALRENVPILPIVSAGAHDTLFIFADFYPVLRQLHEWGMPWLLGVDPEVFPLYLGLPWGLGIGPLPNIPFPVQIYTKVCEPIVFDRYGTEAARDRLYVNSCYEMVVSKMQQALDALVRESKK
jgi:1-acyl-sn-glycerol-3-phosphate acyltransferase